MPRRENTDAANARNTHPNGLIAASLRGSRTLNRLLEARGGTVRSGVVARILGITRQEVHQRHRSGRLLGLKTDHHGLAYPVWQFGDSGLVPGLEDALKALGDASPWTKARFLLSRNVRLADKVPIDALKEGRKTEVLEAAAAFEEHGAD